MSGGSVSALLAAIFVALSAVSAAAQSGSEPFATPGQPIELGKSYAFRSAILDDNRRINILLPAGYNDPANSAVRYPVLYVLDGGAEWQDFTHIASTVRNGGQWGANAAMIVVGIESRDRRAEFTRPSSNASEIRDFPSHGKAETFHRFISQELKPAIARSYRTSGEDGLIGESLAGLFVVDEALRNGGTFRHFIAVSPSLWWDDQRLARDAAELLASQPQTKRNLWLSIADEGGAMRSGMKRLVKALRNQPASPVNWTFHPFPNEHHSTVYHPAAVMAIRGTFPAIPSRK